MSTRPFTVHDFAVSLSAAERDALLTAAAEAGQVSPAALEVDLAARPPFLLPGYTLLLVRYRPQEPIERTRLIR